MSSEVTRPASPDDSFSSNLRELFHSLHPSVRAAAFSVLALSPVACDDEGDDQNDTYINIHQSSTSTSTSTSGSQGSTHSSDSVASSSTDGSVSETHGGTTDVDTGDNTGGGVTTTTDSDSGGMTTGVDTSMDKPGGVDIEGMDKEDVPYDMPLHYDATVFADTPELTYSVFWQNITAESDPIPCIAEHYSDIWHCVLDFDKETQGKEQKTRFWAQNAHGESGPDIVRIFLPSV